MNQNLEEISDGKRYGLKDMARLACGDCRDCHFCCEDMGESVVLDPLDVFLLEKNLGLTFTELMQEKLELHVADRMILPNIKMRETDHCCVFLNEEGRCSIHAFRPGICKVFPLGRIYEDGQLSYFLQREGCIKENRSKVKVEKWLDTPDLKRNQQFLTDWHKFRKQMEEILADTQEEKTVKTITMFLLNTFYSNAYDTAGDFYIQFYDRMDKIKSALNI